MSSNKIEIVNNIIWCTQDASEITFIRYAQIQKIGRSNVFFFKYLVTRKPKGLNRIDKNRCTQLVHFTNRGGLTSPLIFTEVPALSQERDLLCIYVLGVLIFLCIYDFPIRFWNSSAGVVFFYFSNYYFPGRKFE